MPLVSTPAIILATHRYSETSKVVRLATREHGVQSAIAKGAMRPRSQFGAALQVLSEGQAQLLLSERRDLHTLTAFDLSHLPTTLSSNVARYAAATALAEVMLRCSSTDPHPDAFEVLRLGIRKLEIAEPEELSAQGIRSLWHLVSALGFAPAIARCVRDGREIPPGELPFSAEDGGALCPGCALGTEYPRLPPDAREALRALADPGLPLPALDDRHATAHRRLLARYVHYQLSDGGKLPAVDFWVGNG
ncbi:MAG TPA: DNA repair protein RecO [Gemmatimonadales bacterium]|nr:DNA repair protein RecO [Gemmatimonadales bacterium]